MTVMTAYGNQLEDKALANYFAKLVNLIFKILPMRESEEESLDVYMESLLCELTGFQELFPAVGYDAGMVSIMTIIQFLKDTPDCGIAVVRREVFHAISICNQLRDRYAGKAEV